MSEHNPPLGDPVEAWKARGRALNTIYDMLAATVRLALPSRSAGPFASDESNACADIAALGAEATRLRAGLTALRDGNVYGYDSAEQMAAAILDGSWS